jgi:F-type H+-transporting ATPase subunit delta
MRISSKQLAQTLFDLTDRKSKPEIEKSVRDFGLYLARNRKLKLSEKIIESFEKIYNSQNGIIEARVVTAQKLESPQIQKIEKYIQKKYQAKKVILKNIVDENIKGGMIVKVGDEVMDGSLRGKLEELRKILAS